MKTVRVGVTQARQKWQTDFTNSKEFESNVTGNRNKKEREK
jgi:hypothetical protein